MNAPVHAMTREGMLARLEPIVVEASTVVELALGTESASLLLARRFRRARVITVDLSPAESARLPQKQRWFSRRSSVRASSDLLPFADFSVDVVFADLLLPRVTDPQRVFAEVARILRKDGVLLFSTLGPDCPPELREQGVGQFLDMHDVGDAAVRAGLRDPVLDVDRVRTDAAPGCDMELIYGHCWGPGPQSASGEYRIEPTQIGRRRG